MLMPIDVAGFSKSVAEIADDLGPSESISSKPLIKKRFIRHAKRKTVVAICAGWRPMIFRRKRYIPIAKNEYVARTR